MRKRRLRTRRHGLSGTRRRRMAAIRQAAAWGGSRQPVGRTGPPHGRDAEQARKPDSGGIRIPGRPRTALYGDLWWPEFARSGPKWRIRGRKARNRPAERRRVRGRRAPVMRRQPRRASSSTVQPPARPARHMKGRQSWTRPPRTGENRSEKPATGRDRTKLRPSPRSKPALSGPMPSSGPFQQPPWRRRRHLAGASRPTAAALARNATEIRPIARLDQLGKRRFGAERARSGPPRTAPRRSAVHPAHEFQRGTVEIKGGPSNRNRRRAGPIP